MPEDLTNTSTEPSRRFPLGRVLKAIVWLFPSIIAIGVAVFFYIQWQKAQEQVQHPAVSSDIAEASREEIEDVVEELSKVVLLPEGEMPTLSTIKDKSSLTENQEFFVEAENGDYVLVYQQAKKAFLYRPSTQKLINLAPINIADTNAGQAQPTVASASAKASSFVKTTDDKSADKAATDDPLPSPELESFTVELRNGTSKQGLTYDFEPKLLEDFEKKVEVVDRNNAAQVDYKESVVVAVNLTKKAQAQQVANELNLAVAVTDMPAGESKSEADVLIILGADQL